MIEREMLMREKPMREKVVAYITSGARLLVFAHVDSPEAGVQVPAGTIEAGEDPAEAVVREACEETGLCDLEVRSCLGAQDYRFVRGTTAHFHRRHYFHLVAAGAVPERWRHLERHPSTGGPDPIAFELHWARIPDEVPPLAAELGAFLDRLSPATDSAGSPAAEDRTSLSPTRADR